MDSLRAPISIVLHTPSKVRMDQLDQPACCVLARKLENSTRTYAYTGACTDTAVQHCGRAVRCQHPRRMKVLEPVQHQTGGIGGTEEVGRADQRHLQRSPAFEPYGYTMSITMGLPPFLSRV